KASNLTYYDVIYGDGFYYEISAKAPEGKRITKMTYNGEDVADDQIFTVVVNNYRYNGGGNYVKYLNEHGVPFEANDPDRIIYSTQYDMIQGEDNGQARNMLANYIREKGVIDPEITSTWEITTELPDSFEFALVSTTDMHGRSTEYDVATQKVDTNSMIRAASIIKDIRAAYGDDMILVDNGDTIQGNLVAQYAINQKTDVLNPMMEIMIDLGYDTWTMGNHEFNFNPNQRDTQAQFALESGMTALAANITLLEDGVNMYGEPAKAGDPFYAPYVVKTLTDDFGREVKVAIIGFGNPANATWDVASNYPNMQFNSLENPEGDLSYEFQKWINIVNEKEDVDVIVITSHNGTGNENGTSLENQSLYAAMYSTGADLVITGHDHTPTIRTATNENCEEVVIANAGGSNVNLNTFTVTFDENGEVADVAIESENIALATAEADRETADRMEHWFEETYAWASSPVGTFDNGWTELADQFTGKTNSQMVTFQNALVDFVHKGQIWASWQSYETDGIEGATVSIGSAVFAEDWSNGNKGALGFVPVDGTTISTLELSKLYRYSNNLLCAVDLTGEQLWNWMNTVTNYYDVDENGNIYLNSSVFGTDTFYGVDYTIDLTKPYGERLVKATYQGQDLKTYEGNIRCTLNSYRLSGGYGFFEATGVTEADCVWTASMYLGSDRAP
ncbi:MAG: 5'-nucleotidase C-terminal domain-containing protein, partial [Oscillospiraceae bacterium]|nr:5'-nucleotidase C-terminal domain-containing protein [Oscillospiraceae bacterium]